MFAPSVVLLLFYSDTHLIEFVLQESSGVLIHRVALGLHALRMTKDWSPVGVHLSSKDIFA